MKVKIFIESSLKGPAKRDAVVMWLVEYMRKDEPVTREGFIHIENGTEAEGNLKAIINAFHILTKPCSCLVFTECEHILNTMQNHWHIQWMKNEWKNAKGKPVKHAELWEMLMDKGQQHSYSLTKEHHEYKNYMKSEVAKEMDRWRK